VPAPNVYNVENADVIFDNSPKYSFRPKTNVEKPSDIPGPNAYHVEKADVIFDNSPKYSFRPKVNVEKPSDVPGLFKTLNF
jgi:predicted nucleotide-binding protein